MVDDLLMSLVARSCYRELEIGEILERLRQLGSACQWF